MAAVPPVAAIPAVPAAPVVSPVAYVLGVCVATEAEINTFEVSERLNTLQDYAEMSANDVTNLIARIERRTVADGRIIVPQKLVKNIQALCFWLAERERKGEPLNHLEFTPAELTNAKRDMKLLGEHKVEAPAIKPEKFNPKKWKTWAKQFDVYLSNHRGVQNAPLDYVTRNEPLPIGYVHANDRERELYQYPLTGPRFRDDNMMVYRMLYDLVTGTEGESWITEFNRAQNGRAAWLQMKNHYEGGGHERRKITEAEAVISMLHYKNESVFSFESFSTKLIDAFRDLEDTECSKSQYEQVRTLLEKILIHSAEIEIHKAYVRQHHRADMAGAVTYLSTELARMYPQATLLGRRGVRQIAATDGNDPTRQRTGYNSYQPGNSNFTQPVTSANGTVTFFGVDITDPGRTFSPDEMTALGGAGQRYVYSERDRLNLRRAGRGGRDGRGGRGGRGGYSGGRSTYGYARGSGSTSGQRSVNAAGNEAPSNHPDDVSAITNSAPVPTDPSPATW